MWLTCTVINVQGNNYYMVEGSPHVWLKCMVINIGLTGGFWVTFFGRWRGAVCIQVSHVQLTCGN